MFYRVFTVLGIVIAAVLWVGIGWQLLTARHVIPYDPPLRCLHAALPIAPDHTVTQTFAGRAQGLSGVELSFRTTAEASVRVEVHEREAAGGSAPVAATSVALPARHPFYTVHVVFPAQPDSEGKTYAVVLRGMAGQGEAGGGLGSAPLAWTCWSDAFAHGDLRVDGAPAHGDLFFKPLYERNAVAAVLEVAGRFQGVRAGVIPAWLWWVCLLLVLLGTPALAVWAAGGRMGSLPNLVAVLLLVPLVGIGVYWGDPRLHRSEVQAAESASSAGEPAATTVELLYELRKQAVGAIEPRETWDRHLTFAIEPVSRDDGARQLALRTGVNTTVMWREVIVPPNAMLDLQAAVDRSLWTTNDGAVRARVTVIADGATLVDEHVTLIDGQGEAVGLRQTLDLAAHAGRPLTLTLATQGETRNSARLVVWTGLRLHAGE